MATSEPPPGPGSASRDGSTAAPAPPAAPPAAQSDAGETFALAWTRAGLASDQGVTSTLHRQLGATAPATATLPELTLGGRSGAGLVPLETLGEGGMGVVIAARDEVLARTVAVKQPRTLAGARAANALVAEARTLAALDHPNVVPVHALGRDEGGAPLLVMKRVVGRRWGEVVHEQGVDLDRELDVLLQVCDALRYAHATGVLHRDVKADNVMVGGFGEVYLMDWGCACAFAADSVTTEVVGTPACIAPEMMTVGAPIGPSTDVYLLGATLHELLTGSPRHAGTTLREVLAAAFASAPARYPPSVPAELGAILNRACARDPAQRFPTVEAFAEAVRSYRAHRGAIELAHRATALLPALERALADGDPRAEVLFAEARFGFRGALDAWAACEEARAGLRRAHALWIPSRIAAGELDAVEGLLQALPAEEAGRWRGELDAARRRREDEAAALRAGDLGVAARERRIVGVGVAGTALLFAFVVLGLTHGDDIQGGQLVVFGAVTLGGVLAWVVPFWRRLTATRVSATIIAGLVTAQVLATAGRVLGWMAGAATADVLRGEMMLYAAVFAVLAIATERTLFVAALPMAAGAAVVSVLPGQGSLVFPIAAVTSLLVIALVFSRRVRTEAARP